MAPTRALLRSPAFSEQYASQTTAGGAGGTQAGSGVGALGLGGAGGSGLGGGAAGGGAGIGGLPDGIAAIMDMANELGRDSG
jgi:hypothetical protein